jgi:hypothetical protein
MEEAEDKRQQPIGKETEAIQLSLVEVLRSLTRLEERIAKIEKSQIWTADVLSAIRQHLAAIREFTQDTHYKLGGK